MGNHIEINSHRTRLGTRKDHRTTAENHLHTIMQIILHSTCQPKVHKTTLQLETILHIVVAINHPRFQEVISTLPQKIQAVQLIHRILIVLIIARVVLLMLKVPIPHPALQNIIVRLPMVLTDHQIRLVINHQCILIRFQVRVPVLALQIIIIEIHRSILIRIQYFILMH